MRAKLIRGAAVAVIAMVLFWLGGFLLLTRGSDWPDIEAAIAADQVVQSMVGGVVRDVVPNLRGYSYSFSGDEGHAAFVARVDGAAGSKHLELSLKKQAGRWSVIQARAR